MTKKIAILNGIRCHYEMFGYIIYYCSLHNHELSIYTEKINDFGWFSFYKSNMSNYSFELNHFLDFEEKRDSFDIIFLTTDDDYYFKNEWMNHKIICIDHASEIRKVDAFHRIMVRPIINDFRKWSLPCYPIMGNEIKKQYLINNNVDVINISIVGGGHCLINNKYDIDLINRLVCNKKIVLHIIGSHIYESMFVGIKNDIEVKIYNNMDTLEMMNILLRCRYMLVDLKNLFNHHLNGKSMSGSIPLSFSNLIPLIMSKINNKSYNFKSAIEFDSDTNEPIVLPDTIDDSVFELVEKERNYLIGMFHYHINEIININENKKQIFDLVEKEKNELFDFINNEMNKYIKNEHVSENIKKIFTKSKNDIFEYFNLNNYIFIKNENQENQQEYDIEKLKSFIENNKSNTLKKFYERINNNLSLDVIQVKKENKFFCNGKNTAVIVEPRDYCQIAIVYGIIKRFRESLGEKWIIVFYCGKGLLNVWKRIFNDDSIEIRELKVNNLTFCEYSDLFKQREFWKSLYGEYVLVFQADSILKNTEPYTIDTFVNLNKSYIGSNMTYLWNELIRENIYPLYRNFNGGLSLRKRLDMIKIIDTIGVEKTENNSGKVQTDQEDVYFTIGCYKLNLPIGDDNICSHFSLHTMYYDDFFGIHNSAWLDKDKINQKYPDLHSFIQWFPK